MKFIISTWAAIHFQKTFTFKFKCLFFNPHMEEYKKITVNVLSRTYNITHINVYIIQTLAGVACPLRMRIWSGDK